MARKNRATAEFGDFQTPEELCRQVVEVIGRLRFAPGTIIEPSCGTGTFLTAAAKKFPQVNVFGLEINREYLDQAKRRFADCARSAKLLHGDFFSENWDVHLGTMQGPLLIVGNPPWVTNSSLGALRSENLPSKSNFQGFVGLDALTGKSNFDISEWMLLKNLEWLHEKQGVLAVLCKFGVARKLLAHAWTRGIPIADARIYRIDARTHFNAAVEACLLLIHVTGDPATAGCDFYPAIDSAAAIKKLGMVDRTIVSDLRAYNRFRALRGQNRRFVWRSGIKHDCARVMEIERTAHGWANGLGQFFELEDTYLFPLAKSSDLCGAPARRCAKYVVATQRSIGEDTLEIRHRAPLTWDYLNAHTEAFERRTSAIYRNKPPFSIFGVGTYSFAPWKIAISGLYKQLTFKLIGPRDGKPVLFDDTVYFLPFEDKDEAQSVLDLLTSEPARIFLESMIFWEDKRPITAELLKRLDLEKLAQILFQPIKKGRTSLFEVA